LWWWSQWRTPGLGHGSLHPWLCDAFRRCAMKETAKGGECIELENKDLCTEKGKNGSRKGFGGLVFNPPPHAGHHVDRTVDQVSVLTVWSLLERPHERDHTREEISTLSPVPSVASAVGPFPWFAGARMSSIPGSRLLRLADLPEPQREVVLLKHCRGQTLQQIADHLGRTVPSVASLLRRGLEALRHRLLPSE